MPQISLIVPNHMDPVLPPLQTGRKPRPSSSFDSLCSWSQNLRTPSREGRRISMDSIITPTNDEKCSPTSPSRRVSFELDLGNRPIDSFRLPTLSSLKKRRPVAVIKANITENIAGNLGSIDQSLRVQECSNV